MLVQIILAAAIIAIIYLIFSGLIVIIESPTVQEESSFIERFKDVPDCWISKGIMIESDKGLVRPPIAKECIDFNLLDIYHPAESIKCIFVDLLSSAKIEISIDYNELESFSKESVIEYLFERKIII